MPPFCPSIVAIVLTIAAWSGSVSAQDSPTSVPVSFTLGEDSFVTLVIDDESGKRVCNLISETPFAAGQHVVWWDGFDDLGREADHGVYRVAGKRAGPGHYRVRGLFRQQIGLRYEMSPYTSGQPPWANGNSTSGWLANEAPPSAILFVQAGKNSVDGQILVGSGLSLAWLDPSGAKVFGESGFLATRLARDEGAHAAAEIVAYGGGVADGELKLFAVMRDAKTPRTRSVLTADYKFPDGTTPALTGLAARNGLLVASFAKRSTLIFVDAPAGKILGTVKVNDPRGLAFAADGSLLVLSGRKLLRGTVGADLRQSNFIESIELAGIEDSQQIAISAEGNFYVSDLGSSHQVKIFAPDGKFLRAIGAAGKPNVGIYEPEHMNNPSGITLATDGNLWVAENDLTPKRVSVWTAEGKLRKAFYGPPQAGGGGWVDPLDSTRFFYADAGGGMEFALDLDKGSPKPATIYYRADLNPGPAQAPPVTPLHLSRVDYLTNAYSTNPDGGAAIASVWMLRDNVAVPVAAFGNARDWPLFGMKKDAEETDSVKAFRKRLPAGANLATDDILFVWSDQSDDGEIDPEEVNCVRREGIGRTNVTRDLAFVTACGDFVSPRRFSRKGAPIYDLAQLRELAPAARSRFSAEAQPLVAREGWFLSTRAPKPFATSAIAGVKNREVVWTYPSLWPGLGDAKNAPVPNRPGEVIGSTRVLGPAVSPRDSDAGEIWAVNGSKGTVYLFTTDGLFVATLFRDGRTATWASPMAIRGMPLEEKSLGDGSFWTSMTQANDGAIFLQANGAIIRVSGLESVRRLPEQTLEITP